MVNPHSDKKSKTGTTYGPAGMGFSPPKPKPPVDVKQQGSQVNVGSNTFNESTANAANAINQQGIANIFPQSTPEMKTGFGSFFGASSGSTASSPLVQETLKEIYEQAIQDAKDKAQEDNQLYTADMHNQAVMDAFENVYPSKYIKDIPSMGIKAGDPLKILSEEEYLDMAGVSGLDESDPAYQDALLDYNVSNMFDINLMGLPQGATPIENQFLIEPQFGSGGGGSSSVGGGGDYGSYLGAGLGRRPKQLGDEEGIPKGLRLLQYMVNVHKGNPYTKMALRKKSGGIVSLVGG
jgi:hypothetical protein